jgi:spore maturation protein CgeB
MRIFYASTTSGNASVASDLWRNNLYLPLLDLGHDVLEFKYDLSEVFRNLDPSIATQKTFIEKSRPRLTRALLSQVKAAHAEKPIDLFFSYFYDACVLPEAIDEIRSSGIKTVNWYCNGSYQLHLVQEISPHYDWCLVPERFRLNDYAAMNAQPIYCQEAANPNVYKPYNLPVEFDVTFLGEKYADRPYYIRYLIDRGIDVRVWGAHWRSPPNWPLWRKGLRRVKKSLLGQAATDVPLERCGPSLSDEDYIKMFSRSRISLGFSKVAGDHSESGSIKQVRLRDFEAPMSGAFYMAEYVDELTEFFDPGEEIVCFTDPEDLLEKVRYYLAHDIARERIRQAGLRRARSEHTWHKRFEMVFKEMGLIECAA